MSNLHNDVAWSVNDVTDYLSKEFTVMNFTVNAMIPFDKNMESMEYMSMDISPDNEVETFINKGACSMRINDLVSIITGEMCRDMLCNAGSGQLSIFPNGDIFPCHIYSLDEEQRFCLGNVLCRSC